MSRHDETFATRNCSKCESGLPFSGFDFTQDMTTLFDRHPINRSRNRLGLSLSGQKAFERLRVGKTSLAVGRPSNYLVRWLPVSDRQANTTFEDVTEDLRNQVNERDMTYIDEVLTLHGLSRGQQARSVKHLEVNSRQNFENGFLK